MVEVYTVDFDRPAVKLTSTGTDFDWVRIRACAEGQITIEGMSREMCMILMAARVSGWRAAGQVGNPPI